MKVHSCTVSDGQGGEPIFVLDEEGLVFILRNELAFELILSAAKWIASSFRIWIIQPTLPPDKGPMSSNSRINPAYISDAKFPFRSRIPKVAANFW